jgi:hypothetical protein
MQQPLDDTYAVELEVKMVNGMYRLRDKGTGWYLYAARESGVAFAGDPIDYTNTTTATKKRKAFDGYTVAQLRRAYIELKP